MVSVDLATGTKEKSPCKLSQEQIERSTSILTNIFIDFVNSGRNVSKITPQNVFGGKRNE